MKLFGKLKQKMRALKTKAPQRNMRNLTYDFFFGRMGRPTGARGRQYSKLYDNNNVRVKNPKQAAQMNALHDAWFARKFGSAA